MNKTIAKIFSLAAFCITLSIVMACATPLHHGEISFGDVPTPVGSYSGVVERWTRSDKVYNGINQDCGVTATLHSQDVVEHQIFLDAEQYHWTSEQFRAARQKALYENESQTTFFVSLYTDKDENNNLDKEKSVWNIFLDVAGKRVVPTKIKRIYENKRALAIKYPYLNAWGRNYWVYFPIATNQVTAQESELTIAGPLGGTHMKFPQQ